jgi:hypothetical protein
MTITQANNRILKWVYPVWFTLLKKQQDFGMDILRSMTPSEFQAKEGPPGTRETVTLSQGIEITLIYGNNGRVATLEFPGVGPDGTRESVDQAVLDLVPMSMRGKELGSGMWEVGGRIRHKTYEHVMIAEREERPDDHRSVVWVHFKASHQSSSTS